MDFFRAIARRSSAAVALVLFAGTLTCMTAACRVLCAAESTAVAAVAPDTELPPCHRAAAPSSAPASDAVPTPEGACPANSPCCARWIDDHATIDLAAPQGAALEFADLPVVAPGQGIAPVVDRGVPLPLLELAVPAPPPGAVRIPRAPPAA